MSCFLMFYSKSQTASRKIVSKPSLISKRGIGKPSRNETTKCKLSSMGIQLGKSNVIFTRLNWKYTIDQIQDLITNLHGSCIKGQSKINVFMIMKRNTSPEVDEFCKYLYCVARIHGQFSYYKRKINYSTVSISQVYIRGVR